ncbi:sensor histidine kinase [Lentzea sp. NPDC060358]|uniref:sensor histidine kinase n=1 Tax=Lentzea sp. NPDC060358 TaxID=3347103 RepID=UPI00365866B6
MLPAGLRSPSPAVRDTALAVVVAALSFVPGVADKGTALGWPAPQRPSDVLAVVLVLAQALPLAVRSRTPGLALALTSASFLLYQALGYGPTFASIGLYVALYSAGMLQSRHRVAAVVLWCAGYAGAVWWMVRTGSPFPAGDFLLFAALPAGCWLLGTVARGRLREQSRRNRERADDELREERERIARELHDVVTHHVTAMVMQADAAQYVDPADRPRITAGLVAIGSTGRKALADLRELLNVLTPPHDARLAAKAPALSPLAVLVEQTRAAGQPVELVEDDRGHVEVSDLVRLTAYRVVQEGLTNALKHAPGCPTTVRVTGGDVLVAEVTTWPDGPGVPGPAPVPSGRGLAGLRRRVSLAGGELTAYRRADGAFVLSAELPRRADHA